MKTIIIAEVGVNHNGSLKTAKKLISKAAEAGADFVKFQTFNTEKLVTKNAHLTGYQKKNLKKEISQYKMLKKYEFSEREFLLLKKYCHRYKINFLSSAFDIESLNFLKKIGQKFFKIPSGEITNLPLLIHLAKFKKKVFLSTGMSNLNDISSALNLLLKFGTKKKNITILQCNTDYPTDYKDVNLLAMNTLKSKFKMSVGYSDHSSGIEVPIAAVALGATVIEKHFTLNKKAEGPDHLASLDFKELKAMIKSIRNIEKSLGSGRKKLNKSEKKNIIHVRKSIVANQNIEKNEKFSEKNLTTKRPGSGISPMKIKKIIGKKAKKFFYKDELIKI